MGGRQLRPPSANTLFEDDFSGLEAHARMQLQKPHGATGHENMGI
jgi:hypothetical protein